MTRVKLPTHLFEFEFAPSIITPGNDQYNGADISIATDATGNEYVGFTAKELSTGVFGFVIWDLTRNRKVSYTPFCNARGEVNNGGKWIAWNNKDFHRGMISGFVPHTAVNNSAAVEALQRASEAQAQTIAGIELALGNINQEPGQLDAKDREVLDRMRGFFGLD